MSFTDDNRLIEACLRFDRKAQKALYEKYKKSWFLCCLRYAANKAEAEDMLQDAAMAIFSDLATYDARRGAFSTWSHRVVVHAALRYIRKWRPIDSLTDPESSALFQEDESESVYEKMGAKELLDMVQSLPTGYRLVFNLYVLEGFKHAEIAEKLNISVNTSKTQLLKAKRMLRKKLEALLQKDYP